MQHTETQQQRPASSPNGSKQVRFGPKWKGVIIDSACEALMLKKVQVCFNPNRAIIGYLARNSSRNNTLCVKTGTGLEELYGTFFFEPAEATFIREVL